MKKKPSITIVDIAKEAGTSISTVSRIINNTHHQVNISVKKRVLKIIDEKGYAPNPLGRTLRVGDIQEIGVILPTFQNPFYTQVLSGIEKTAAKMGYNVIIYSSHHSKELEARHIKALVDKRIRGMIIANVDGDNLEQIRQFANNGGVVASLEEIRHYNCIAVDQDCFNGAKLATQHLIANGHRNIAFLSLPLVKWTRKEILNGYIEVLKQHGIPLLEDLVITCDEDIAATVYEFECGKVLAERFLRLDPRPTAILTVNDITAFGIIQILLNSGVKVPDDVSIVGFDNIYISPMISPRLTTVSIPSAKIGSNICDKLIEKMKANEDFEELCMRFEAELIVRDSVKNIDMNF